MEQSPRLVRIGQNYRARLDSLQQIFQLFLRDPIRESQEKDDVPADLPQFPGIGSVKLKPRIQSGRNGGDPGHLYRRIGEVDAEIGPEREIQDPSNEDSASATQFNKVIPVSDRPPKQLFGEAGAGPDRP